MQYNYPILPHYSPAEVSRVLQASNREFAREMFATLTNPRREQLAVYIAGCADTTVEHSRIWLREEYGK